ncbi:secretin and TonB N-terminal domain-containing protein [Nitrosomonas ureae]|uniref:General secretion pathway protein D n=1 Tax=Nitrosomonas ureae TaxID=44577 RepID=A0A1H9C4A7_9PROT|nr:secretin and TonB N-terminal domain-containing protein [Nitrosomonas ureae]PTQ87804.1 general secretion pathway protein D [Nitrosomonas ureae]PXX16518.1 general secretion pathway protein D [Nitrosomonas ureae]SEP95811.1 general secretion pathway protein D [Nitrosomonas ureae]
MRSWKTIVLIILSISIAGCAINNRTFGTRNTAFDDGQKLIAQGQFENGLAKLEQAQREEPDNKEIRTMLIRLREDVISKILLEADGFRFSGDLDQAEQQYQRVLNLYPFHERAKEGIDAVKLERRHIAAVDAARALLVRNDFKGAETMVRAILQENPQQSHARQLIAQINANLSRPEVTDLALESAFKKSVSMEFKDADLKSVFEIMSRTAGINFVFDKDIRQDGKISIFVRDNTIEDILKLILTTNQLAYKVLNSNSLLIYPNTPAKLKDYQELVVRSFQVAYTDVKQMVAMVRGIVKAKDIYVNEQLNLFIMRDTLEAIRLTERLVSLNDLAEPEVMLDVAVLEITRNNLFTLGPKLPQSVTFSGLTAAGAGAIPGTANLNQIGSGALGLKSFTISNQAVIDFAQSLTNADILANPRIRVSNREKAKIHIGTKQPVFTANVQPGINSIVTSTPTFIDIGIKLDVEPRIGLNDDVTMKVTLEVSNITGFETGPSAAGASSAPRAPVVGNRSAETLLTLKDGETQVIAGLIQNDERRDVSGLAGLLNIPILDRLTSGQRVDRKKTEVVLLITPRIIRNIPKPANMESEYHFGTASEAGKLPVVIQKTAAQSLAIAPTGTGSGAAAGRGLNAFAAAREESDIPNPFANVAATTPTLTMQAPTTVGLDKEFSVNVRLVGAKPMVNSELQLNYEASVLEALDGGDKSGTRTIKLGRDQTTGLATQVRFKVIAANPGITEISIQNVTAEDLETGESVDVALPATATVNVK